MLCKSVFLFAALLAIGGCDRALSAEGSKILLETVFGQKPSFSCVLVASDRDSETAWAEYDVPKDRIDELIELGINHQRALNRDIDEGGKNPHFDNVNMRFPRWWRSDFPDVRIIDSSSNGYRGVRFIFSKSAGKMFIMEWST